VKAKYLDQIIYDENGSSWHTEEVALTPSTASDVIAASIRQLDQFHHPMVVIRLEEYEDSDNMNITGGLGVYVIEIEHNERFFDYIDIKKGKDKVEVWTSDQGAAAEERYINRDVEQVIAIAQDYAIDGQPSRRVDWLYRR
jgi:hypothetical protein